MKFKIFVNYILFIILFIIVLQFLSYITSISISTEEQLIAQSLYNHKQNYFDIVVIGPSNFEMAWNSMVAFNNYGITSLNYSFPSFIKPALKQMIKIILKEQKPKLIIVDVSLISKIKDPNYTSFLYRGFIHIPFSLNKVLLSFSFLNDDVYNLKIKDVLYSLFPIIMYHNNTDIHLLDSLNRCRINNYYATTNARFFLDKDGKWIESAKDYKYSNLVNLQILRDSLLEEQDLLSFLKGLDVDVLLTNIPYFEYFTNKLKYDKSQIYWEEIADFLKKMNIEFINLDNQSVIEQIKLSYFDFFDEKHFNYWGAEKFTNYLAKILVDKYNLQDKRNNPDFYSWNISVKEYIGKVKESFSIDISL